MIVVRPRRSAPRDVLRSPRRSLVALVVAAALALAFVLGAASHATGFFAAVARPLLEGGVRAPWNWLRAQATVPTRIEIDVKFEDLRVLEYHRERALRESALFASDDETVPATLRSGDQRVKAKIRLKGDSIAHLQGRKWSFRVDVRGEKSLFGMKRFSLHHPQARNWLAEWIYHRALAREDILSLRYDFVDVSLNGDALGIYALEEHFDKRLIEHRRRREGPILRFDENLLWLQAHEQLRPFLGSATSDVGSFAASAIDAFRTGATLADPVLREELRAGAALLEGFRKGDLSTHDVFDVERLATYLALTDLLGAEHGARWHNLRFYYNPLTLRLEPIGFDGSSVATTFLQSMDRVARDPEGRHFVIDRPFARRLFADAAFYARYLGELERIAQPSYLDDLLAALEPDLTTALRTLHREFPQVEVPEALLRRNQAYVRSLLDPPAVLRARAESEAGAVGLRVANLQPLPVEVVAVRWRSEDGAQDGQVKLETALWLDGRSAGELAEWTELPAAGVPADVPLALVHRWPGTTHLAESPVTPWAPRAPSALADDPTRAAPNADAFPFLERDAETRTYTILRGPWSLREDLRLPAGFTLRAGPGTRLDLLEGAMVLVRGPLELLGEADAPVRVTSSDATGQGVFVLSAGGESRLRHVEFAGLGAPERPGWPVTGAVTFYESPLDARHVSFTGNRSEDALNVVRGRFSLDDVYFADTASDAFDGDFTEGRIVNSRFARTGNDAIDVSGSSVDVDNVVIEAAGDKGISTGEASELRAERVRILGANLALASKDLSSLWVKGVTLRDCTWAVAAFQKKAEFGPARVEIEGYDADPAGPHLIERGSAASIDGVALGFADDRDIKAILYEETDDVAAR